MDLNPADQLSQFKVSSVINDSNSLFLEVPSFVHSNGSNMKKIKGIITIITFVKDRIPRTDCSDIVSVLSKPKLTFLLGVK